MKVHSWGEELTVHSLEEEVGLLDGILVAVALHHTLKNNKKKVLKIKKKTFFFWGGGGREGSVCTRVSHNFFCERIREGEYGILTPKKVIFFLVKRKKSPILLDDFYFF